MAVDVGSAVGYLDLDINGFLSGLRSAQSEADSASKGIEKKFESIGATMEKVGKTSTAFITTPIVTAITGVVKNFGDLEQSIGGVETMFKDSAGIVIKNAESAYKTAGVSANSYMEQVTSISARLLQGLGGDTVTAAKIADTAIIDMSDNSNKFGTNLGSIQDAYQGFAKSNFTMLDNLKLGYGGTATEMARLINDSGVLNGEFEATAENVKDIPLHTMFEAIHQIQDGLGVTGTTAKEAAETISGSFGMAKASITDFLAQLGNPGADMDMFAQNMFDSFKAVIDNVKRVLATLWENLPIEDWQKKLLVAAAAFGPVMFAAGKVVSTIGTIIPVVGKASKAMTAFGEGFKLAKAGFPALGAEASKFGVALAGISAPMIAIVAAIAVLIAAFATLWKTNEDFRNKMIAIWNQIKETVNGFLQGIVDRVNALGFDFNNIADMLWSIWKGFCDLLAPVFEGVFQQIANILDVVFDVILGILDIFIGIFTGNWEQVWEGIKGIFKGIWDFLVATFQNYANVFTGILDTVCGWFGTTWENTLNAIKQFFVDIWNGIVSFFVGVLTGIQTFFQGIWEGITSFITTTLTTISTTFSNIWNSITSFLSSAWETIKNVVQVGIMFIVELIRAAFQLITLPFRFIWENCKETIISIWDAISNTISKALTAIQNVITTVWNAVSTFFTTIWTSISAFISTVWNTIKTNVTNAINAIKMIIDTVFNAIKTAITTVLTAISTTVNAIWNTIKTTISNIINSIKATIDSVWNAIKTTTTTIWNAIKTAISNVINSIKATIDSIWNAIKTTTVTVWNAIKTAITVPIEAAKNTISNIINTIKSIFTSGFNAAKSTVTSIFDSIKSKITSVMDGAKNIVSGAINKIKSFFNFSWSLPKLKMPHFKISGSFSLNPPSVPKFGIEWYKKAMGGGMILDSPTIFGFNSKTGKLLAGGEAGSETVVGTKSLLNMIKTAVHESNVKIIQTITGYLDVILDNIKSSNEKLLYSIGYLVTASYQFAQACEDLSYVAYNGFVKSEQAIVESNKSKPVDEGGDTFIFNSPKPIDEIEAAKRMKQTKRELAEGF